MFGINIALGPELMNLILTYHERFLPKGDANIMYVYPTPAGRLMVWQNFADASVNIFGLLEIPIQVNDNQYTAEPFVEPIYVFGTLYMHTKD